MLPERRYLCQFEFSAWHGFLRLWNLLHIAEMSPFFIRKIIVEVILTQLSFLQF